MFRTLTTLTAPISFAFGLAGMAIPGRLAGAFGLKLDGPVSRGLARLACASFVGYSALNWLARDVTDAGAQRAIAAGNATGWLAGGTVTLAALSSPLGTPATWSIVGLQAVVGSAWLAAACAPSSGALQIHTRPAPNELDRLPHSAS